LTGICFEGRNGVAANEVAEFGCARSRLRVAWAVFTADLFEGRTRFGSIEGGSARYSSTDRCGDLSAKLLPKALTETFDGHLAA
jgi:hypothetical protein